MRLVRHQNPERILVGGEDRQGGVDLGDHRLVNGDDPPVPLEDWKVLDRRNCLLLRHGHLALSRCEAQAQRLDGRVKHGAEVYRRGDPHRESLSDPGVQWGHGQGEERARWAGAAAIGVMGREGSIPWWLPKEI